MTVGKTIARIEEHPYGEYGRVDDVVLVHFTDGTALEIEGHSYEPVSQSLSELDQSAVRGRQRLAQGFREADRVKRLQRLEWLSISCEERAERRRRAREAMSPHERMFSDSMKSMFMDQITAFNRMSFGSKEQTIIHPCKNCGERECANSTREVVPAVPAPSFSGGFSVVIEPGSAT